MEVTGSDVYFVSDQPALFVSNQSALVKLDTLRLLAAIKTNNQQEKTLSESVVCKDADTISLDAVSKSVTVLSTAGVLFVSDTPQTRLDLNTVCGDSEHAWTAVDSRSNRILAAGIDTSKKTIEYVLVDA